MNMLLLVILDCCNKNGDTQHHLFRFFAISQKIKFNIVLLFVLHHVFGGICWSTVQIVPSIGREYDTDFLDEFSHLEN